MERFNKFHCWWLSAKDHRIETFKIDPSEIKGNGAACPSRLPWSWLWRRDEHCVKNHEDSAILTSKKHQLFWCEKLESLTFFETCHPEKNPTFNQRQIFCHWKYLWLLCWLVELGSYILIGDCEYSIGILIDEPVQWDGQPVVFHGSLRSWAPIEKPGWCPFRTGPFVITERYS